MKILRLAVLSFSFLIAVLCLPGRAAPPDTAAKGLGDIAALVTKAVTYFNKGDEKSWAALCVPRAPVINSNPPFQFSSCSDWWDAGVANNKRLGISNGFVTLQPAWQVLVNGDRAYAVYPAAYAYKLKGKAVKNSGVLTIAMQRIGSRWMMSGWSWSQH
jgi:hypothetical protein